jgi:hypothetical protein
MARTQIDLSVQAQSGTLFDAQVADAAQIAHSKLASAAGGQVLLANTSGVITATTMSGDVTVSNTGDVQLVAGAIIDSDINAAAAIATSKLANTTPGYVLLGATDTGVQTSTQVTGDIGINGAGVVAITAGAIIDSDVNAAAAIATSKLADSANFLLRNTSNAISDGVRYTYDSPQTFSNNGDLVTKAYVDGVASGLDLKDAVKYATTAAGGNINLATGGLITVDGSVVADGDRVLVKDQTLSQENGIYVAHAGAWVRAADADNSPGAEVTTGMFCFVTDGALNNNNGFVLTTPNPITLGTTPLSFAQFSGAGQVTAGAGLTKTGNTLSVIVGQGLSIGAGQVDLALDANGTLAKTASGLKLADLASANILIGSASNVATARPITGDVTLLNTGATTVTDLTIAGEAAGKLLYFNGTNWVALAAGTSSQLLMGGATPTWRTVVNKEVASRVNGTQYTIANAPLAGTEHVYVNGMLQRYGAGMDYQLAGANITFENALQVDDTVLVTYWH